LEDLCDDFTFAEISKSDVLDFKHVLTKLSRHRLELPSPNDLRRNGLFSAFFAGV
jgi:hypothetical protein